MSDQIKNFMIGLFVLAAACIVIFILMFLNPRVGDERKHLRVRFTNIDKVTIGTRVTYAGRPVGEVYDIREVEFGREGPKDASGHIYLYELDLRVDSKVNVFNTDEISLRTSGLLGERNIEITPIAPSAGVELKIVDEKIIYANETSNVEDTLKEVKEAADKFEIAMQSITETLARIRDENIIDNVSKIAKHIVSISNALDNPQALSESIENVHTLTQRANKSWDTVDKTIKDADVAAINAQDFFGSGKDYLNRIATAEGSFNRLFFKDDLYLRTNALLSKGETILDDINHYGLLFNTDKGWQRLRARRLNLMQKLSSPQEFRNYFNDEIDQISTSISRVSMVLEQASNDAYACDRMQDREFAKVFAELMRRVTMLEEEVRMYNTQVVEAQIHETELGTAQCFQPPCCDPTPAPDYQWCPQ